MHEGLSLELEIAAREVLYHFDMRTYEDDRKLTAFNAALMRLRKATEEIALYRQEGSGDGDIDAQVGEGKQDA